MNYEKYKTFCKVVEIGSLSGAAEALGYTQSGVSRMIQSLERQFGCPLLIRNKAGIRLTENGSLVLGGIRAAVKAEEELRNTVLSVHQLETGSLRIGVFPSVEVEWLPSVIQSFQKKYPNIEITLIDGDYAQLELWLLEGTIDFCFLSNWGNLKVNFLPLYEDEMMAVLPKTHPFATCEVFPVEKFAYENFIFPAKGMDADVNAVMKKYHIVPNIKYRIRGDDIIIAMVRKELGIGLLPKLYLKEHHGGTVTKSLCPKCFRQIGIGLPTHHTNQQVMEHFMKELRDFLK